MPVPTIDFNVYADNRLPPNKRLPKWIIWIRSLIYMWRYRWGVFYRYMNGSDDVAYWDSSTTYNTGDLAIDINGVYESLVDSNLNNATTDEAYWIKLLDSFIGVNERVLYTPQKLSYEKYLNRVFGTVFRQPTSIDPGVGYLPLSDIYITTDVPAFTSFVMYPTWYLSSAMYPASSFPYVMYTTPLYPSATTFSFTIHIPVAVFTALGATTSIRESIVRKFADQYQLAGVFYSIVTY